jgi:hypothetical protein
MGSGMLLETPGAPFVFSSFVIAEAAARPAPPIRLAALSSAAPLRPIAGGEKLPIEANPA